MQVLVADDDPVHRRLVERTLLSWGYQALVAADGTEAWRILEGTAAPQLVLLDWIMPGLNGDEICRRLRQRPRDGYTYVLLLTARQDRSARVAGLESGADDFLAKPFDPAELRARLNTGRRIIDLQNQLIAAREAMRRQATRDSLTEAWNHAAIIEILEHEIDRSRREKRPLGLILGDLDHFKRVNDQYGHLAGDAVLREAYQRMAHAMRPYDLVGRYGGEEFLIVLPGCDLEASLNVGDRIRQRISDHPVLHADESIPVTISLGATVSPRTPTTTAVGLIRAADRALYLAKDGGRNRVVFLANP
ncbi:MAG: diguanylate cyclase [Gemmataceae bacterium]